MLFCSIHTKQYIGSLEEVVAFHTEIQFPLLFSAQFYQGERIKLNSLCWVLHDSFVSKRWEVLNKLSLVNVRKIIHSGMAGNGGTWTAL